MRFLLLLSFARLSYLLLLLRRLLRRRCPSVRLLRRSRTLMPATCDAVFVAVATLSTLLSAGVRVAFVIVDVAPRWLNWREGLRDGSVFVHLHLSRG